MNRLIALSLIVFFISCSEKNKFPELATEKVSADQIKILDKIKFAAADSILAVNQRAETTKIDLSQLKFFQNLYLEKDSEFDLEDFEKEWGNISEKIDVSKLNSNDAKDWFEINGMLLQITGEAQYAEEMESIVLYGFSPKNTEEYNNLEKFVAPYIFTKNVDHIHINLYTPAQIEYEHSLYGHVKIWQETNFPDSEKTTIHFNMEEHRYIEVFVRIPSWAKGATVTALGVKYFAPPGDYAFIAKKWKEGDTIEIHFPKKSKVAAL